MRVPKFECQNLYVWIRQMDFPSLTLIYFLLEVLALVPLFSTDRRAVSTHLRTRAECRGVSITPRTGTSKPRLFQTVRRHLSNFMWLCFVHLPRLKSKLSKQYIALNISTSNRIYISSKNIKNNVRRYSKRSVE